MLNKNLTVLIEQTKKLRILYVEDDEQTREYTLDMLNNFFCNISIAVDGKDGLDKFNKNQYDVIFTDINMPNMNGIEMIEKIREFNKEISIIMLSAYDDVEYFLKTIKAGIDGYLLKPFEFSQIEEIIFKIIDDKIDLKQQDNRVRFIDNFYWDKKEESLYCYEKKIVLTRNELALFRLLTSLKHATCSSMDIEIAVFDDDKCDDSRVRNLLSRLKRKLQSNIIESIYGQGYRLKYDK